MKAKVVASFDLNGQKHEGVEVVNPREWFGKTWVIRIEHGHEYLYFVVEGDSSEDAIDVFVDSHHGHYVKIEPPDLEDYNLDERSYYGNPSVPCDIEEVYLWQLECRYHLPEGIDPQEFA